MRFAAQRYFDRYDVRIIMKQSSLPIAVVDSGLGGLSVLRELLAVMPDERYLYLGDTANAPYGTKDASVVRDLTLATFETLRGLGMKAFVLACNTATGVAIDFLRQKYGDIFVGVEPPVKSASMDSREGKTLVLLTVSKLLLYLCNCGASSLAEKGRKLSCTILAEIAILQLSVA